MAEGKKEAPREETKGATLVLAPAETKKAVEFFIRHHLGLGVQSIAFDTLLTGKVVATLSPFPANPKAPGK